MKLANDLALKELLYHRKAFRICYFLNLLWVFNASVFSGPRVVGTMAGGFAVIYCFASVLWTSALSSNEVMLGYVAIGLFLLVGTSTLLKIVCRRWMEIWFSRLNGRPEKAGDGVIYVWPCKYSLNFPEHSLRLDAFLREKSLKNVSSIAVNKSRQKI